MEAVLIIPNEKKIKSFIYKSLVYFKILKPYINHVEEECKFADKNEINISIYAPINANSKRLTPNFIIANAGHIVFEINEEYTIGYLPDIITKRQRKIMNVFIIKLLLENSKKSLGGFVIDEEGWIINKLIGYKEIYDFLDQAIEEKQELQMLKKR